MTEAQRIHPMADRLKLLHQCGRGTEMGALLRKFWQPVGLSTALKRGHGKARAYHGRGPDTLSRRKR